MSDFHKWYYLAYTSCHFHIIYHKPFGGEFMKGIVEERAAMLGEYIIESKATVRKAAKKFGISKSTVHKDVSQRLRKVNPALYREVRQILETNKSERHIRGGMATKNKYLLKKQAQEREKLKNSEQNQWKVNLFALLL
mgnify:CR=1 FL=1